MNDDLDDLELVKTKSNTKFGITIIFFFDSCSMFRGVIYNLSDILVGIKLITHVFLVYSYPYHRNRTKVNDKSGYRNKKHRLSNL